MNRKDIILMADASGLSLYGMGKDREQFIDYLECFAKLVAEQDCVGWFGYDTGLRLWFETNKGDDGAIPLYKTRSKT